MGERFRLAGAHAVVTGGSSGIGLATARALAGRGAAVSLVARDPGRLAAAARCAPGAGAPFATASADVADGVALAAAITALEATQGPTDILVASAGVTRPGHFAALPEAEFHRQMDVNYFGTLHAIRAVAPGMVRRGHGSIVCISSAAGLLGVFGYSAYGPTKYAVRGLAETVGVELRPHGVQVAVAYPPDVDTPMLHGEAPLKPPELVALSGSIRPLSAERVAAAIVDGIERRRCVIVPDPSTRVLRVVAGAAPGLTRRVTDLLVARARAARPTRPIGAPILEEGDQRWR
ncbi:MAG: SDR family NAD(P)-dependent oxidoreductase [Acidimicrobiales bacterium]|nr:SDR family NAD(P)-dependent oxidoreductase [Acidimicrobiales bacterium]